MTNIIRLQSVAFDESGHTGQNLLDADQPLFVHASICLPPDDAAHLVRMSLTGITHDELHFSKLRGFAAGRQCILTVLDSGLFTDKTAKVSLLDKKFLVTVNIVDTLIEPFMHKEGVDLYNLGGNLALANVFHLVMPVFLGIEKFNKLLELFVQMVRTPNPRSLDHFFHYAWLLFAAEERPDVQGLLAMILSARQIAEAAHPTLDKIQVDPAVPGFFRLASAWSEQIEEPFVILHDQSKPIAMGRERLEGMMNWQEPPRLVGYDRRKVQLPLRAVGIKLVNSAQHPEIQLADLVAGAMALRFRPGVRRNDVEFADAIRDTNLEARVYPVRPEKKVTPEELDTDEPAEFDALLRYVASYQKSRDGYGHR